MAKSWKNIGKSEIIYFKAKNRKMGTFFLLYIVTYIDEAKFRCSLINAHCGQYTVLSTKSCELKSKNKEWRAFIAIFF